jgi:RNA polymerase sigma factor (sigma-70 family)
VDGGGEIDQNDALLLPFLQATDEIESQRFLEELVSKHAEPIIREIIKYKLRVSLIHTDHNRQNQDAEDVYSEVVVQVLAELREFKANSNNRSISNFRSYVATITYHTCYEYLREKYPRRSHLKDRLRYLLTHHNSFALWESNNEWICGFIVWKDQNKSVARTVRPRQLYDNPQSFRKAGVSDEDLLKVNLADLLARVFNDVGSPVELEFLINIIAELMGIKEQSEQTDTDEEAEVALERLTDPGAGVDTIMDQRDYLRQLWLEICQLPQRQRAALLLNLKDEKGRGIIVLFTLLGIAAMDQIAEVLDITADRFAVLWNGLPLDDAVIAEHLGVTRQQVINLRKSARERLTRRMKAYL